MIAIIGAGWIGDQTITPPTGWSTRAAFANNANLQHTGAELYYKVASSEPDTWTWTSTGNMWGWAIATYQYGNLVLGATQGGSSAGVFTSYTNSENNAVAVTFGCGRWFSVGSGPLLATPDPTKWDLRAETGSEGTYPTTNRKTLYIADQYVASGNFPAGTVTWTAPGAMSIADTRMVTAADFDLELPADEPASGALYDSRRANAKALPYTLTTGRLQGVPWHEIGE